MTDEPAPPDNSTARSVPTGNTVAVTAPLWWRLVLLVVLGVLASVYICLLRVVTEAGVPYLGFLFWQTLVSAAILLVVLAVRRTRFPMSRRHLQFYVASGLLGSIIPLAGMTFASSKIPVGVLSMTIAFEPALTYLLALVLLLERYHTLRFAGLLIGIAGLLLIFLPQTSLPSPDMIVWVAVALAIPVSWAVWSNWMAFARPPDVDSAVAACGLLVFAAVMLLPPVAALGELWWFVGSPGYPWWYIPVFAALNVILWLAGLECIRVAGPVFYSVWAFLATPLTIGGGMIFFGERHSVWIWSALALLLASLYLVNMTMGSARLRSLR